MSWNRTVYFFLFFLILLSDTRANDLKKNVDSLLRLTTSKDINIKLETLTEVAWEIRGDHLDSAIRMVHRVEKMITPDARKKVVGYVYHILGSLYSLQGDYEQSELWLTKAYEVRKKHETDRSQLLATMTNLFYTYQGLGQIKKMHVFISEAENLIADIGEEGSSMHIITVLQMAEMYRSLKRNDKAEEYFKKAIKLAEEVNKEDYYLSMAYTNYGNYFTGLGKYQEAIKCFEKAAVHDERLSPEGKDYTLDVNMAIAYAETGQMEKAKAIFTKVYEIRRKGNNPYEHSTSANNLGFFYLMSGETRRALELFTESLEFAKKAGAANLVADRYQMISECYEKLGDLRKSLDFMKLYQNKKDSLLDAETLKQLNMLTEKYDNEKKEKKILELKQIEAEGKLREKEQEEALNEEREQGKRNNLIFGSLSVVVLIIAGFIFYSYQQKKKANLLLEGKNKEIETQHMMLEEKHKEITDSINYAKRIQTALLTSDEYWKQISKENFVYFRPKDVVSGDFFWAFHTETDKGALSIWCAADCTGHGVPGAFMSMLGISFLNEIVVEQGEIRSAEILNKLRVKIIKALEQKSVDVKQRDGMDLALCVWKKWENTIEFSGANNPLWIIRKNQPTDESWREGNGNWLKEFKPDKMPVGSHSENMESFTSKVVALEPGDMIYTFSDGYSDQFGGEKGKKFKEANFKKLLHTIAHLNTYEQKEAIHHNFDTWKGQLEQIDDVCVIGVRV